MFFTMIIDLFNENTTQMMDGSSRSRVSRHSLNEGAHYRNIPSLDGSSRISRIMLTLDGELAS